MLLIKSYLLQLLFSVGIIVAFGVVINFLNKKFFSFFGRNAYKVCVLTGFVGTPVHELSHATMCVVFGHKVLKIKMFPSLNGEKTLGYVNHSYNKKNLYHLVGNFFIGLAPVIFGSLVIYLLMFVLANDAFKALFNPSMTSYAQENQLLKAGESFVLLLRALFSFKNLSSFKWWLFIVLACSISIHMSVSPADIKASKTGFLFVAVILFALNFAFYLVDQAVLIKMTDAVLKYSVFVINFLTVAVILCLGLTLLALILRPVFSSKK